ncbi:restriction endonuclease subunit S [Pelosinus sp. IPA-1]|uniref:restriction endonuclease subunit S n=1 Tax=Pelosinus sp. IPA-1 TaxID=3029569 RepID=UPI00243622F0|nr:restriction endonuclease subunit S [Pelosinus sp. IPA-1]GMA98826.1 type I restriction-modification system restriction endonuclease DNA specificity subunit HsdS [Pelosinus sp. IPA-1]
MKYTSINKVLTDKISGEWGVEPEDDCGVKIIRTANFTNLGVIDFSKIVFRKIESKKIEQKKLISGDVIVEKSGGSPTQPVGRVVYFENPDNSIYLCNNFTTVLRANKSIVFPKYLFYILFYNHLTRKTLRFQNKTTGIINLKLENYLKSEIPLPPLDDQIRIATVLTRAEKLIAKRKESIKALDELLKSTFLEMFGDPVRNEKGWEEKVISDVCDEIVDCVNKTAPQSAIVTPYIMIRTSNIRNGKISLDVVKYVDEATYAIWTRRSVPRSGDILFTREAPMGEVGLLNSNEKVFLGQRVMQYRCNNAKIKPIFLLYIMQTGFFSKQIERLGKGSTVKHLTVPDCFKFIIPVPPLTLQNQFAAIVKKIESLKIKYNQSLTELKNLYGSLSQRAFKGELDLSKVSLEKANQVIELSDEGMAAATMTNELSALKK